MKFNKNNIDQITDIHVRTGTLKCENASVCEKVARCEKYQC